MTYGSRDASPPLPPFRKNGEKETRGGCGENEGKRHERSGGKEGRDIRSGVSGGTTEDIALCFLSGQMIYRVSPYIAASYYNPRKNT